jgi:hypothetical protein
VHSACALISAATSSSPLSFSYPCSCMSTASDDVTQPEQARQSFRLTDATATALLPLALTRD